MASPVMSIKERTAMGSNTQSFGGGTINLTSTPDAQLEALRKKKEEFTGQLETNTTKAANVARLDTADSFESQKNAAMQAAREAGRPWTNADELQWSGRKNRAQQQQQNQLVLQREKLVGDSINAQDPTINNQISQQLQQKQQQLEAVGLTSQNAQREADRVAQQAYQAAQLKIEQQRLALQQSQNLQGQMYGQVGNPGSVYQNAGGGGTGNIRGGGGRPAAAPAPRVQINQAYGNPQQRTGGRENYGGGSNRG